MKRLLLALAGAALVAGCGPVPRDENYVYYHPPVGTQVTVHKTLDIPPGRARVFLQNGQIVAYTARNQYYPNCEFEINTVDDTVRQIQPDTFRVNRVQIKRDQVAQSRPVQVAGVGIGIGMGIGDIGSTNIMWVVEMYLKSAQQPDVLRLTCRGGEDRPSDAEPPSINEMRHALGDYASIELPPDRP